MPETNGTVLERGGRNVPKGFMTRLRESIRGLYTTNLSSAVGPRGGGGQTIADDDFDRNCKYPCETDLTPGYYRNVYERWPMAARVVNIWPDNCWAGGFTVSENDDPEPTEFESDLEAVFTRTNMYHYLHRTDRESRVHRFAVLFLGWDDGGDLAKAPAGVNPRTGDARDNKRPINLMYARTFSEDCVTVAEKDTDVRSPRYGMPTLYDIRFGGEENADPGTSGFPNPPPGGGVTVTKAGETRQRVHWTRVIHVPGDNLRSSEIYAVPPLRSCINILHDIRKVLGSAAEMFKKGGFPGYAFETYPDLTGEAQIDPDELRAQIYAYQEGFERFLATVGGKWTSLQPQVANPTPHMEQLLTALATNIDVPKRKFLGSESGHLASTQDDHDWVVRCQRRQTTYQEPFVLRPLTDRLIAFRAVRPPVLEVLDAAQKPTGRFVYHVKWQDLRTLSLKDRAEVGLKQVQTLMQYMTGNCNFAVPLPIMLRECMGWSDSQIAAVQKALKAEPPKPMLPPALLAPAQSKPGGGQRDGKAGGSQEGRPVGSVEGEPK